MDFRVFHVVAIEVARKTIAEMVENGGKWQKIDFRGYLVGNGFPRVLRHSPTTNEYCGKSLILSYHIYDSKWPILHENTSLDRRVITLKYEVDGRQIVFIK